MRPVAANIIPSTTFRASAQNDSATLLTAVFPGDRVVFSATAQAKTDAEKLQLVHEEALRLFLDENGKPKSRTQIITAIQKHFNGAVEVFDGSQPGNEWVNDTLKSMGNRGMFNPPDTVLYPEDGRSSLPYSTQDKREFMQRYVGESNRLQKEKRSGLFVHKDASLSTLMHETFHALQLKNGLSMGASSVGVQYESNQFRDFYNLVLTLPVITPVVEPIKRLLSWLVEVPYLLFTKGLPSAEKETIGDTPGKALRNEMRREMEVDKFLLANGRKLGLTMSDYLNTTSHFVFESALQYFRSLWLD